MAQKELKYLEAVSKTLRREDDDIREDGRKPPESARRWPCRPSSTRDKADESDSWIASAATEVFLRPLLATGLLILGTSSTIGCTSARYHADQVHSQKDREITVGIVQREIRNGMSGAAVAEALGSPNIVTRDETGDETWVYHKIASYASYSNSEAGGMGGLGAGVPAGAALILGIGGGSYQESAGASASTQKTLTVVIKFDQRGAVKGATYHSSTF